MPDPTMMLLKSNLKQLKLPTMLAEYEKLAREAAKQNESFEAYLLRLSELEVATRSANAIASRIRAAGFTGGKQLRSSSIVNFRFACTIASSMRLPAASMSK